MSLLEVKNLSLSIGGTEILKSVSLSVAPGKILGVIGESGSGKSMTAYSIMQLLPPDALCSGEIRLGETDLITATEPTLCTVRGRVVSMVFQEPMTALNPLKTIGDQVCETIRQHEPRTSRKEANARAAATLARCELPNDAFPLSRYPHELSGGQRQRVVIAMAIALRPRLLIADEPTTALDVTTQAGVLALLQRLVREDNMGLMLITHDLAVVTDLADQIVIMKSGHIVERGPGNRLHQDMQHPYTRALFAASAHRPPHRPPRRPAPARHPASRKTRGAQPLLEVQSLVREYILPRKSAFAPPGRFRAVNAVSFTLNRGENLGLVGESGCGKSTLTRAILGLEPLQGGAVYLDGDPVRAGATARALRRKMQVVFQDPYGSFNPRHRVARLIAEPLHLVDVAPTGAALARAIDVALCDVGLEPADKHRFIHEFSGGQRQRIALARALITRPELIILDEAVSALDVSIRAQVLDLLAHLSDRHDLAYLFISHDLSVVRNICDRVMVMQAGEIVEEGRTEAVYRAPAHPYTQTLMAATPRLPEPKKDVT